MDPAPEIDVMEEVETKLEVVGEKRSSENGGDCELMDPLKKKAKVGVKEMKRVAEIMLVLSAMAEMRGGRSPTAVEAEMMAEARAKVASLCEILAPKDIVEKESIETLIEDLGLNSKAKEQKLGFRPPRMSIAEKFLLTKRRMEESREFAAHSGAYSSQRGQTGFGAAPESRGGPHTNRVLPSDSKPINAPIASPPGSSSSLPYKVSSVLSGSSSVPPLPRAERASFKLDAGVRQAQVNAPAWSLNPQSASSAKSGPETNYQSHTIRFDGNTSRAAPPHTTRDSTSRSTFNQTTSGNLSSTHQPLQKNFVQAPLIPSHIEIGKIVHKLLQPHLPEHPTWTPPSRDYMNKAVICQICQLVVNEVESVLLCDACDKGFHLKCLHAYNQKTIPRGEWHCPKCLTLSNGKPLPPKYGRVMRNMNTPKGITKISETQSNPEKKVESADKEKPDHDKTTGSDCGGDAVSASEIPNSVDTQGNNFPSSTHIEDNVISVSNQSNSMENVLAVSSFKVEPETEKPVEQVQTTKSPPSEEVPVSSSNNLQDVDQTGAPNNMEMETNKEIENASTLKKSYIGENSDCSLKSDIKKDSQDNLQTVEWIGDELKVVDEKTFYSTCCISGVSYKLLDYVLIRSTNEKLVPSKLQAMWEDIKTGSKWLLLNCCYFPEELPEAVGRPYTSVTNEVYESNHDRTVLAGLVQGPCEVLSQEKYKEESEKKHAGNVLTDGIKPIFMCRWLYDESKKLFQPIPA